VLPTVELDSLAVEAETDEGQRSLVGFAVAAAGIGQRFFDKYYEDDDPGPLTIVSVIARAVTSLGVGGQYAKDVFKPFTAKVTIDGVELPVTAHGGIHAGAFDVNLGGVIRVFPLARERGTVQFQAGAITAPQIVAALPALFRGRPITTSPDLRDTAGHVMEIEATGDELLRPVVDGEIYQNVRRLRLSSGPRIRVARV